MAAKIKVDFFGTDRTLSRSFTSMWKKADTFGKKMDLIAGRMQAFGRASTMYLTLPLAAAGIAAWKYGAEFDGSMRQVQAASGATAKQMDALTKAAKDMGYNSQYSAQEAAQAMLELAKSGITPAQIKAGALATTMKLAAAGGLQLEAAATAVANALNTFGLKAAQANQVANALAGGANASSASVESLQQGLAQVGAGAVNAGLSLQETVGVLSAFANRGIQGSDAGTSLKTMLQRLIPTTDKAAEAMDKYNLSFVDGKGNFDDITTVAQKLQDRLGGLSEAQRNAALQAIFGSDATRAATVLMREGEDGIREYIKATKDKTAAGKMAAAQENSDAGKTRKAMAALKTAAIDIQVALAPVVTTIAENVAKLGRAFGALSDGQKDAIVKAGMFLAVMGPASNLIGGSIKVALRLADAYKMIAKWAGLAAAAEKGVGGKGLGGAGKGLAKGALLGGTGLAGIGLSAATIGTIAAIVAPAALTAAAIYTSATYTQPAGSPGGQAASGSDVGMGGKGLKPDVDMTGVKRALGDLNKGLFAKLTIQAQNKTGPAFRQVMEDYQTIKELTQDGIELKIDKEKPLASLQSIQARIMDTGQTSEEAVKTMERVFGKDVVAPLRKHMERAVPTMEGVSKKVAAAHARMAAKLMQRITMPKPDASGLLSTLQQVYSKLLSIGYSADQAAAAIARAVSASGHLKSGLGAGGHAVTAKGGVFYGAQTRIIAEDGPEAVVPLTKPREAAQVMSDAGLLGGSGSTEVNVYLDSEPIAARVEVRQKQRARRSARTLGLAPA